MGHLPADAAFQWLGMVFGAVINQVLYGTGAYLVLWGGTLVLLGFQAAFGRLPLSKVLTHGAWTLALLVLFGIGPRAPVPLPRSRAEEQLPPERIIYTAREMAQQQAAAFGVSEPTALPRGMLLVSQAIDGTALHLAGLIDPLTKIGKNENGTDRTFLNSPWAVSRALTHLAGANFGSDQEGQLLARDYRAFKSECQFEALRRYQDTAGARPDPTMWRPDHPTLVKDLYGKVPLVGSLQEFFPNAQNCNDVWTALAERIATYAKPRYNGAAKIVCHRGSGLRCKEPEPTVLGTIGEQTLGRVLSSWAPKERDLVLELIYANNAGGPSASEEAAEALRGGGVAETVFRFLGGLVSSAMLLPTLDQLKKINPYLQGGALAFLYALYAFPLLFAILPGKLEAFFVYLVIIFSVKMWTFSWALVAALHKWVLPLTTGDATVPDTVASGTFSVTELAFALLYIVAPAATTAILAFQGWRVGAAMSQAAGLRGLSIRGSGAPGA